MPIAPDVAKVGPRSGPDSQEENEVKPRLITRINSPHGGGIYIKDPLTGWDLEGTTFVMVYDRAVARRRANSVPIGLDFEDELEAAVCAKYPDECEFSKRGLGISPIAPSLWDVVRGSAVMMQHKWHGSQLVSQEEANRRAEICNRCPFKTQMTLPCARCTTALENVVNVITGSHSTPYDEKLAACGICKCYLSASVWLPLETQCVGITEDMKERFDFSKNAFNCWKNC